MWIAKDWANPATQVKSRTMGFKFGIKLPAWQTKHPSIQMSICKAEGGFAQV